MTSLVGLSSAKHRKLRNTKYFSDRSHQPTQTIASFDGIDAAVLLLMGDVSRGGAEPVQPDAPGAL
jgi:hypothetical protein